MKPLEVIAEPPPDIAAVAHYTQRGDKLRFFKEAL
jgi:hypothetical protein